MSLLNRILGRDDDSGWCDFGEHDYGPWSDLRWRKRLCSSDDSITVTIGYEMERECRDCGKWDSYWRPEIVEVELDVEWWDREIRGSEMDCELPMVEDVDVDTIYD